MTEQSSENVTQVPPCPSCHRPLGLYYSECANCLVHANDYPLADYYPRIFRPVGEES